jgi:hypothetical protein
MRARWWLSADARQTAVSGGVGVVAAALMGQRRLTLDPDDRDAVLFALRDAQRRGLLADHLAKA